MTSREGGTPTYEHARFVARDNRFVVRAARGDGEVVRAHLANTARLTDLLVPGARLVLVPNADPTRLTRWSVTRVWDGTWVALEAGRASGLVADHLGSGGALPGWPAATAVRREVTVGAHRFDLSISLADGREATVEVKSLSRAHEGVATLSVTPSTRGVAHLGALAAMAAGGATTAVAFVVQRGDAEALDLTAPADPAWAAAVRAARDAGVHVVAYRCEVDERALRLGRPIEVQH